MKVMTILGTRPEIIRLARVIDLLDRTVEHILVHTGQNYDFELSEIFFRELGVRRPDRFLGVDTSSLGRVYAGVLVGVETALREHQPDALLVLGDTNSAIGAIMAKRLKIPVYHMEAGNRSFDANVPEEINRRMIDHISDFNLVYTEQARRNLLAEGLPSRRIVLTGSPLGEVLQHFRPLIESSTALRELGLTPGGYLLASLHREENVDHAATLQGLWLALTQLGEHFGCPVLLSTHPRTRNRLEKAGLPLEGGPVRCLKPFGYPAYVHLQQHARCVVSDSGTVSEESALLGFPAITPRRSMERPEALDTGSVVLCGVEPEAILRAARFQVEAHRSGPPAEVPAEYRVTDCSYRVTRLILGTVGLTHEWAGIRRNDLGS